MYITELEEGAKVEIQASDGIKSITLESAIASIKDQEDILKLDQVHEAKPNIKFIVLNPIRRDDLLINFVSDYVFSHLIAIVDGNKPVIWRNVTIVNIRLPKYGSVHILMTSREGETYNRRQHYRVTLDCEGLIRIRTAEKETIFNVFVKDISESGIGFSIKGNQGLERGSRCIVEFKDAGSGQEIRSDVVIIRVQEMENNRYMMGCKIRQRSAEIAKFINKKQKDRMKRS